jgi:phosphate transport system protein
MMEILGVTFDPQLALEFGIKIVLALVLGGLVGLERERLRRPAGLRTFMLVSVGSCVFTLISYRGFTGGDPTRVAAQIVSGIGFLGAGITIQRKGMVYGLTSAAGVWAVAAVGMAVGTGNYYMAVFATVAIVVVLGLLRRWFKSEVQRTTRRTLNTALRQVRNRILAMGNLVDQAIRDAIQAAVEDDHELAKRVIEEDDEINELRYKIEEECLEILRTHSPVKIEMRSVLAASQIATNLERMGDYAKEIAQLRVQKGDELLPSAQATVIDMTDLATRLLQEALAAFASNDVEAARRICNRTASINALHDVFVATVTETMTQKKTRRFDRGAALLTIAYDLKRIGERIVNIAERIVFVRTGALAEIDRPE